MCAKPNALVMATVEEVSAVAVASFCCYEMPEYLHFSEILNGGDKSETFDAVDRQCSSE
jgi:hypothetical protein